MKTEAEAAYRMVFWRGVSLMATEPQKTYYVLYRPAGEWHRYELTAVDLNAARKEAERLAPKGYEVVRIDEVETVTDD